MRARPSLLVCWRENQVTTWKENPAGELAMKHPNEERHRALVEQNKMDSHEFDALNSKRLGIYYNCTHDANRTDTVAYHTDISIRSKSPYSPCNLRILRTRQSHMLGSMTTQKIT